MARRRAPGTIGIRVGASAWRPYPSRDDPDPAPADAGRPAAPAARPRPGPRGSSSPPTTGRSSTSTTGAARARTGRRSASCCCPVSSSRPGRGPRSRGGSPASPTVVADLRGQGPQRRPMRATTRDARRRRGRGREGSGRLDGGRRRPRGPRVRRPGAARAAARSVSGARAWCWSTAASSGSRSRPASTSKSSCAASTSRPRSSGRWPRGSADRRGFDPASWDADQERAARTRSSRLPRGTWSVRSGLTSSRRRSGRCSTTTRPRCSRWSTRRSRAGRARGGARSVTRELRAPEARAAAGRPPIGRRRLPAAGHNLMRYARRGRHRDPGAATPRVDRIAIRCASSTAPPP